MGVDRTEVQKVQSSIELSMFVRHISLLLVLAVAGCANSANEAESGSAYVYRCESGHTVRVSYPSVDTATVEYEGKTLHMNIAISASGARYTGEGLEWWSKGSGPGSQGTLFRHRRGDGSTGETLERCKEIRKE